MAIKLLSGRFSQYPYGGDYIAEYICDTDADFADLPEASTGSTAISIESGNIRIVNTQGEWVPFAE